MTENFPLKDTDLCVMCGMCLPHCPTYLETTNEAESPRGRISLMQGIARNQLAANQTALQHLDNCTGCLACESICPAQVPYGRLLDDARALTLKEHPIPSGLRQILTYVESPKKIRKLKTLADFYQGSGAQWIARKTGILKRFNLELADSYLEKRTSAKLRNLYPAQGRHEGDVGLFTGCIQRNFEGRTLSAAITLLIKCGYTVHLPESQGCCGALHQHNGLPETAERLRQNNIRAFTGLKLDALLYTATGCGAQLNQDKNEYPYPLQEISQFLAGQKMRLRALRFNPLNVRIGIHEPCSLQFALKQSDSSPELLSLIPGAETCLLSGNHLCCGAGGGTMLVRPEMSDRLRRYKLQAMEAQQLDVLVSTNIGCAMHIRAGSARRDKLRKINIMHPVSLLAQQLCLKDTHHG